MEKLPKIGNYQPLKSFSMVYDDSGNIVDALQQTDIVNIKEFRKDPDIPGKIRGYICLSEKKYIIYSYQGIANFIPATKPKKKKGEK